jgi:hypothetical protein
MPAEVRTTRLGVAALSACACGLGLTVIPQRDLIP